MTENLRDRRIRVTIGINLFDKFHPTGGILTISFLGLKINELPSRIARDIFWADDLAICFHGQSLETMERHMTYNLLEKNM